MKMNRDRRKKLAIALDNINNAREALKEAFDLIGTCKDEEETSFDNLPQGIQDGDRGCIMQDAIDNMTDAYDTLDDILSSMDDLMDAIGAASE